MEEDLREKGAEKERNIEQRFMEKNKLKKKLRKKNRVWTSHGFLHLTNPEKVVRTWSRGGTNICIKSSWLFSSRYRKMYRSILLLILHFTLNFRLEIRSLVLKIDQKWTQLMSLTKRSYFEDTPDRIEWPPSQPYGRCGSADCLPVVATRSILRTWWLGYIK